MHKKFKKGDVVFFLPLSVTKRGEVCVDVGEVLVLYEDAKYNWLAIRTADTTHWIPKNKVFLVPAQLYRFINIRDNGSAFIHVSDFIYYLMGNNVNNYCLELCDKNSNKEIAEGDYTLQRINLDTFYLGVSRVLTIEKDKQGKIFKIWYSKFMCNYPKDCVLVPEDLLKELQFDDKDDKSKAIIRTDTVIKYYLEKPKKCDECYLIRKGG